MVSFDGVKQAKADVQMQDRDYYGVEPSDREVLSFIPQIGLAPAMFSLSEEFRMIAGITITLLRDWNHHSVKERAIYLHTTPISR